MRQPLLPVLTPATGRRRVQERTGAAAGCPARASAQRGVTDV